MNNFCVDLKVCEGCGGLWLRAREVGADRQGAYCKSCVRWLSEFPAPKQSQRQQQGRGEAQRKRRRRNRAARAAGAGITAVIEVKSEELELAGVGGGR